jgi:HD-like signal output (HDOD) protein
MRELESLNFLSPAVVEIINIIDKPETSVGDLIPLISIDRILYSNIFKYTSSAAFGMRRSPSDLNEAVQYLGLCGLRDLIFLIAGNIFFKEYDDWYRNVFTAQCARSLAYKYGLNNQQASQVYMAALIFDLGALLLKKRNKKVFKTIEEQESLHEKIQLENQNFGTNRINISYSLLGSYGLPDRVMSIVQQMELHWQEPLFELENFIIQTAHDLSYLDFVDELDLEEICKSPSALKFKLNDRPLCSTEIRKLHHRVKELIGF